MEIHYHQVLPLDLAQAQEVTLKIRKCHVSTLAKPSIPKDHVDEGGAAILLADMVEADRTTEEVDLG